MYCYHYLMHLDCQEKHKVQVCEAYRELLRNAQENWMPPGAGSFQAVSFQEGRECQFAEQTVSSAVSWEVGRMRAFQQTHGKCNEMMFILAQKNLQTYAYRSSSESWWKYDCEKLMPDFTVQHEFIFKFYFPQTFWNTLGGRVWQSVFKTNRNGQEATALCCVGRKEGSAWKDCPRTQCLLGFCKLHSVVHPGTSQHT